MFSLPLRPRVPLRPLSRPGRLWAVVLALACLASLLLVALPAQADDAEARRAESPYFFVKSDDPTVDRLPLKATEVDARIAGPIADVTVTQRYRNEGQRPIEARYVFPGSTQAAVHAMTVRIGNRVIVADIREKQRARIEFETAKREGKTAALLEQERQTVGKMVKRYEESLAALRTAGAAPKRIRSLEQRLAPVIRRQLRLRERPGFVKEKLWEKAVEKPPLKMEEPRSDDETPITGTE